MDEIKYEEAPGPFLECLDKKLEEMGVIDFYSDPDLKDAMYLMVRDVIKELEEKKNCTESKDATGAGINTGLQMAQGIIKDHFGLQ